MKRRITLTIGLVLGVVVLSLMSSEPTAHARKERVFRFDTGITTLGPNQLLRIVTDNKDPDGAYVVSFTQMTYTGTANGGLSRYNLVSQTTSDSITVAPAEGFSIDIGSSEAVVRGVVLSDTQDVQVTAQIIDTTTGNIIAILIGFK